jgi:hypothetical protein
MAVVKYAMGDIGISLARGFCRVVPTAQPKAPAYEKPESH